MHERLPQVLDVDRTVCALFSWAPSGEIEEDAVAVEQDVLMFNITAISNVENALKRKQTDFTTQTHANFKKTAPQLIANEKRCPNNWQWHAGERQVHNEKRPIIATSERTFEAVPCFLHGDRFTQEKFAILSGVSPRLE